MRTRDLDYWMFKVEGLLLPYTLDDVGRGAAILGMAAALITVFLHGAYGE